MNFMKLIYFKMKLTILLGFISFKDNKNFTISSFPFSTAIVKDVLLIQKN